MTGARGSDLMDAARTPAGPAEIGTTFNSSSWSHLRRRSPAKRSRTWRCGSCCGRSCNAQDRGQADPRTRRSRSTASRCYHGAGRESRGRRASGTSGAATRPDDRFPHRCTTGRSEIGPVKRSWGVAGGPAGGRGDRADTHAAEGADHELVSLRAGSGADGCSRDPHAMACRGPPRRQQGGGCVAAPPAAGPVSA